MKVADYLEKNKGKIRELTRLGYVSTKLIMYKNIHDTFKKNTKKTDSKMDAYEFTAIESKVSTVTVMRAVKAMNENIKK